MFKWLRNKRRAKAELTPSARAMLESRLIAISSAAERQAFLDVLAQEQNAGDDWEIVTGCGGYYGRYGSDGSCAY